MKTLSTGEPATLGSYRRMAVAIWGEKTKPVQFLDGKISAAPNGENEEVLADEGQMVFMLATLYTEERHGIRTTARRRAEGSA